MNRIFFYIFAELIMKQVSLTVYKSINNSEIWTYYTKGTNIPAYQSTSLNFSDLKENKWMFN